MRKILALFIFLYPLFSGQLYGMDPQDIRVATTNPPNTPVPISNRNNLLFTTLKIEAYQAGGRDPAGSGTGFLWEDPDTGGDIYLITNKHVAGLPCSYWNPQYYSHPTQPHDFSLYVHIGQDPNISLGAIQVKIKNPRWLPHQSDDVDLCAFLMNPVFGEINGEMFSWNGIWSPIYFPLNTISQYCFPFPPPAALLPHPPVPPLPQLNDDDDVLEVLMIGYPDGREDLFHKLPLLRKGIASSDPNLPFNGREEFVIDMESTPGSSGSPVLYRRETNNPIKPIEYYLLGVFFLSHNSFSTIKGVNWSKPRPRNASEDLQYTYLNEQNKSFPPYFNAHISLGNVIKSGQLNLNKFGPPYNPIIAFPPIAGLPPAAAAAPSGSLPPDLAFLSHQLQALGIQIPQP